MHCDNKQCPDEFLSTCTACIDKIKVKKIHSNEDNESYLMQTLYAKQRCNGCGEEFYILYKENGDYEYCTKTCECEDGFSPACSKIPSISQWLDQIKNEK